MKNKQFLGFVLALVMLLSLAACGAPAAPAAQDATPAPAADAPSASAEPYQAETPALSDVDTQLRLIHSMIDRLLQQSGELPWFYTVTDLDHDGSLEFIAAAQHPQDRSTNLVVWEVNADRSALTECIVNKDPEESFPDIMTDSADTYHDPATGVWSYMFYDNVVLSDKEVYTSKSAFHLQDGVISYQAFAVEHTVVENNARTVSFTDAEGNNIMAESYISAGMTAFEGAERSNTGFEWLTVNEAKNFTRLVESYQVFMGERKPTENFPVPAPAALAYPEATATPVPTSTPRPTATPAPTPDPGPAYLVITKNPTNETRKIGSTAKFVACANAFEALEWTMIDPVGNRYTPQDMAAMFGASVDGLYSTTLSIIGVTSNMDGWGAYCTFYYKGQIASTSTAYILISNPDPSPTPVPQEGSYDGYVSDFGYDYVTVHVQGVDYFTLNRSACRFAPGSGSEIYIGAPAQVYYDAMGARGPHITSAVIVGRDPEPQPEYGAQSARAFRETDGRILVGLNDGSNLYLDSYSHDNYEIRVIGGSAADIAMAGGGDSCTVYYLGTPTAANVYLLEVTIDHYEPEPEPEYHEVDGWAHHDSAFSVYVEFADGSGLHIRADVVELVGPGTGIEGAPCTVYYTDALNADSVYRVEIDSYNTMPEPAAEEAAVEEPAAEEPAVEEAVEEPAVEEAVEEPAVEEAVEEAANESENG